MAIAWNDWIQYVEYSSKAELAEETQKIELDQTIPFVEKKLKLGYLYFKQDLIGTATNLFHEVKERIAHEKHNSDFVQENEQGLKILRMGWSIIDDGCGGFEIVETGCGCGPFCGCLGIVVVMAVCGIEAQDVCSFDSVTGESGGCIGEAAGCCCNCCDSCYTGKPGRYT